LAVAGHKHDDTDDFFLVLKGRLVIELRDRSVSLGTGELFVVPKGVEHRPVAKEEVHLLLIEPSGTPNTGDLATAAAAFGQDQTFDPCECQLSARTIPPLHIKSVR
jgi:mannose-6-phosphate isomerase-like protein (cupin superfamily)